MHLYLEIRIVFIRTNFTKVLDMAVSVLPSYQKICIFYDNRYSTVIILATTEAMP
eukprot:SAG11_NODE_17474_length_517_cov_1.748804_1_plen_54_part_10